MTTPALATASAPLAPESLLQSLRRLWSHLSARRRRQFGLLLVLMLLSAMADVVSLGAVIPFLAVLSSPEAIFSHPGAAQGARLLGFDTPGQMLWPLTATFVTAAILAGAIRLLLLWASSRLGLAAGADISLELYRRTLYQPFRVHVARNSSEVISGITGKVDGLVHGVLQSLLTLTAATLLIVALVCALVAVNAMLALVAAAFFAAAYALVAAASRHAVRRNSERIAKEHVKIIKTIQEGLGGISDVLLDATQPVYCDIYSRADRAFRTAQAQNTFASQSPRYVMEAFGMAFIAVLAYGLSKGAGGLGNALPTLGALALGAQRLLPALQQTYGAWTTLSGNRATLADTLALLEQPLPPEASAPAPKPLAFERQIELARVRFRYASDGPWVLDGLDLTVRKGTRVGFVGSTGSGKSTTMDLLMGLLQADEGALLVDGKAVTGHQRVRAWQRVIAHVPQSIFLSDSTIAENIAFGVAPEAIDMKRVRRAAGQAQIADFIEKTPAGYATAVGERGVRLSGGQRQRIGIARALYKEATVLLFDEATSSLDNVTEQSVMEAMQALGPEYTLLIIAHRLSTVRRCDTIVELDRGRVAALGSYDELLGRSASFRNLVAATRPA